MSLIKYITFLCAFQLNHARHMDYKVKQCVEHTQQCFYSKFSMKDKEDVSLVHFCVNKALEEGANGKTY